ncbi:MAG: hypothetical protein WBQ63_15080, partial [Candidatus Acidiferrales bacterium]
MSPPAPAFRESSPKPSPQPATTEAGGRLLSYGCIALLVLGVIVRILVVALPGNALRTPWGGGGDTPAYVLLAHNLL